MGRVSTVSAAARLRFEGPALDDGSMDARQLASALLAYSDLVHAAQAQVAPDTAPADVRITATEQGSFVVDLVLGEPSLVERVRDLFSGENATAAANAAAIVAAVGSTVGFVVQRARRGGERDRVSEPDGSQTIVMGDGNSIRIPPVVVALVVDPRFMLAAQSLLQPLSTDGVDAVTISADGVDDVVVSREDTPAFYAPTADSRLVSDTEVVVALQPATVAFHPNHRWRVTDGGPAFWVRVGDVAFLTAVATGEVAISAQDTFLSRLRVQQFQEQTGKLRTERTLVQVLEHSRGAEQLRLPYS